MSDVHDHISKTTLFHLVRYVREVYSTSTIHFFGAAFGPCILIQILKTPRRRSVISGLAKLVKGAMTRSFVGDELVIFFSSTFLFPDA